MLLGSTPLRKTHFTHPRCLNEATVQNLDRQRSQAHSGKRHLTEPVTFPSQASKLMMLAGLGNMACIISSA